MNKEIYGAELNGQKLKYSFREEKDGDRVLDCKDAKQDTIPHKDLLQTFKQVIPHLVAITEQKRRTKEITQACKHGIEDDIIPTTSIFFPYRVTKFSITGKDDNEAVKLWGHRVLSSDENLPLETFKIKRNDDRYDFSRDLWDRVDNMIQEVWEYHEGKRSPLSDPNQVSMAETPGWDPDVGIAEK